MLNESNGVVDAYRIRYFIRRNETTVERFNQAETGDLSDTTMMFTGLQEGVVYGFQVLAITVGDGPYSPVAFNETESAGQFCCQSPWKFHEIMNATTSVIVTVCYERKLMLN